MLSSLLGCGAFIALCSSFGEGGSEGEKRSIGAYLFCCTIACITRDVQHLYICSSFVCCDVSTLKQLCPSNEQRLTQRHSVTVSMLIGLKHVIFGDKEVG